MIGNTKARPRVQAVAHGHGRLLFLEFGIGVAQSRGEGTEDVLHLARHGVVIVREHHTQPEPAQRVDGRPIGEIECPGDGVVLERTGEHVEPEAEVGDRSRQWTAGVHVGLYQVAGRAGYVTATRHQTPRRLQAVHATEVRRSADRSADVAPELERAHARGDRGRGPAR